MVLSTFGNKNKYYYYASKSLATFGMPTILWGHTTELNIILYRYNKLYLITVDKLKTI